MTEDPIREARPARLRVQPLPPEARDAIERIIRERNGTPQLLKRAEGFLLLASGATVPEVMVRVRASQRTVTHWRQQLCEATDPLRELMGRSHTGRPKGKASARPTFDKVPVFRRVPLSRLHPDYAPVRAASLDAEAEADDAALRESIRRYGVLVPLVAMHVGQDSRSYRIIDGHRRYRAAHELGLESVPVLTYRHLSRAEFEQLRFCLNDVEKRWTQEDTKRTVKALREVREAA